jgi:hypothetical protein
MKLNQYSSPVRVAFAQHNVMLARVLEVPTTQCLAVAKETEASSRGGRRTHAAQPSEM